MERSVEAHISVRSRSAKQGGSHRAQSREGRIYRRAAVLSIRGTIRGTNPPPLASLAFHSECLFCRWNRLVQFHSSYYQHLPKQVYRDNMEDNLKMLEIVKKPQ